MPAAVRSYDDLRIRFEPLEDAYRVHVTAPCGEASGQFELPFADLEVENFVLRREPGQAGAPADGVAADPERT